jgi:two-component system sensor histidine kinase AlgZ
VLQPLLLLNILVLYAFSNRLAKLPYKYGVVTVALIALFLANIMQPIYVDYILNEDAMPTRIRFNVFTLIVTSTLLAYFNLRSRALSPAIAAARLQALQARIRPHFLFNCINAVLSLIRSDPKRAETALEDMADLFRVLMADNRELVPLQDEVTLCRQYLELEKLRLGDRLQIVWHIDHMPADALIPPLVLQPLLENAVYHGIEPSQEGGEIIINIYRSRNEVHMVLTNPYRKEGGHHKGNKMALSNIRERLSLHFDIEASLSTKVLENRYQVHIVMPLHRLEKS